MKDIILQALTLLISAGAFLLGKYVFPNVPKSVTAKLRELAAWADKFVVWAREFRKQDSGHDKMEMVVEQLQAVAKEAGWDVTEDQLRAIAQTAYENMIAGAAAAQQPQEAAQEPQKARYYKIGSREFAEGATVVINAPGVAVATDNVPEGALDTNPDGSVNAYDEAGMKVGTVDAATAEAVACGVDTVIVEGGTPGQAPEAVQTGQEATKDAPDAAGDKDTAQAADGQQDAPQAPENT